MSEYTHNVVAIIRPEDADSPGNILAAVLDPDDGSDTFGVPNVQKIGLPNQQAIAIISPIKPSGFHTFSQAKAGIIIPQLRAAIDAYCEAVQKPSPADAQVLSFVNLNVIELGDRSLAIADVMADKGYEWIPAEPEAAVGEDDV